MESCFTLAGQLRKPADSEWAMDLLNVGKAINPKLQGLAIDYIPRAATQSTANNRGELLPSQEDFIAQIRELHAKHWLMSCVSTEDLQSVPGF